MAPRNSTSPLRIAVLINTFSPNAPSVRQSFLTAISLAASSASPTTSAAPIVSFYDPIITQQYPDPATYSLIVLSGGTADPMGQDAWVLSLQSWLRTTVEDFPRRKILGICWGHQTLHVAFGGAVSPMPKAELGIRKWALTDAGKAFFAETGGMSDALSIHEYHRRQVIEPAKGYVLLAEENQAFVSEEGNILTFQGHPEMGGEIMAGMLAKVPEYMGVSQDERIEVAEKCRGKHDGVAIWRCVLQWISEV